MKNPVLPLLLLVSAPLAHADAPAFDRPGIAFTPTVIPSGMVVWEQGLSDFEFDHANGVSSTSRMADTRFRFGLGSSFEIQIAGSLWNRLDLRSAGSSTSAQGVGDSTLALKWAPALSSKRLSAAVLGSVSLDTGSATFTNGRSIYSVGATIARDLGASQSIALYAIVDYSGGVCTWALSPSFSFPLGKRLAGFLEVGTVFGGGQSGTEAGGGLTLLVHDRVQLDVYVHHGLTSNSTDARAGFGVSVYWN